MKMDKKELLDAYGELKKNQFSDECKSCYGCTGCDHCTFCYKCKSCTDCTDCGGCDHCTDCTFCNSCYNCTGCTDCKTCYGCTGCKNCVLCVDLKNKINGFWLLNKEVSKEEFLQAKYELRNEN